MINGYPDPNTKVNRPESRLRVDIENQGKGLVHIQKWIRVLTDVVKLKPLIL